MELFSKPTHHGPFIYEMHHHTAGCSACAHDTPAASVKAMKQAGLAGMVLTNHFYHGNTGISRKLAWPDFVQAYTDAYLEAKTVGDKLGFDVLFGLELGVGGGKDVLLYGITPQWALAHPEMREFPGTHDYMVYLNDIVHEAGGLIYQAHPFRVREYIADPWKPLSPDLIDGVEGYNACNSAVENARAVAFAKEYTLPTVAGSDSHTATFEGRYGIRVEHRLKDEADLARVLRQKEYELCIPDV